MLSPGRPDVPMNRYPDEPILAPSAPPRFIPIHRDLIPTPSQGHPDREIPIDPNAIPRCPDSPFLFLRFPLRPLRPLRLNGLAVGSGLPITAITRDSGDHGDCNQLPRSQKDYLVTLKTQAGGVIGSPRKQSTYVEAPRGAPRKTSPEFREALPAFLPRRNAPGLPTRQHFRR